MTTEGWIFMAVGWGIVGVLVSWCFWKLFHPSQQKRRPPEEE